MKPNKKFKNRVMVQLTSGIARLWKYGMFKYSYTNLNLKVCCKGFLGVSGRYFYFIDFMGTPEIISFIRVPGVYRKHINPDKIIYRYPSRLAKIEKRPGMR